MARNTATYTVTDANRDNGKTFLITEMPAAQAEAWAMRAILALMDGKVELPEGIELEGMAGLAKLGIKALAGLRWDVLEPLMQEMFTCIQIIPDPSRPNIVRPLIDQDIEEIMTRVKLRGEVWALHTGFSVTAALSKSPQAAVKKENTRNTEI